MTWISTIAYEDADPRLKKIYNRVKGPDGRIDNILMSHSLRPASLQGHMTLYKGVLHHSGNALPKWLLEAIGVYVSLLNGCDYCVEHHYEGMLRLQEDPPRSAAIREALTAQAPDQAFSGRDLAIMQYVYTLTVTPTKVTLSQVDQMRAHGMDDGEVLEVNQVAAYFSYANRTVLGLGVNTKGDELGLSPNDNDDPGNWSHT